MNDFLNKNKIRLVILAIAVVVLLTSASYAYFIATVSGNQANSNIVKSGVMEVTFDDGQLIGTPTDMIPGQSITKSFTVTNTGSLDSEYVMYLSEVVNDFNPTSDLEYKLEKLSDEGYTKDYTECPTAPVAINDVPIAIGVGQTHSYKLTIRFKETNASQDSNKGKQFKARIQINEYNNAPETISGTMTDEGGNPIANQAMVAFSNPVYFTTDANGHYEITLPGGNHNIYFIPGVSEQELRNLGESVKNSSDTKTVAIDTHITDNITFNNYHLKTTITIHPENGNSNYTVEKELDVALGSLVEPVNGIYPFSGWYSDSDLKNKVTSDTIVSKQLTDIYARYTLCYSDDIIAVTPKLYTGLIPVTIDESGSTKGTVRVANRFNAWYNYGDKKWANAVIVKNPSTYISNGEVNLNKVGQEIPMSDIVQMYVWIPRYRYKLFNAQNSTSSRQMINIEFVDTSIKNDSSKAESQYKNNEWYVHPAFTFGGNELDGIWFGKFEMGYVDDITVMKPSVSPAVSTSFRTLFNRSRSVESTSSLGLKASQIDTHIMKNVDWGAVAYLSYSKYGRFNSSGSCISSGCRIWTNNVRYKTGCSGTNVNGPYASNVNSCSLWNDATYGGNGSTTGNVYGIYDMAGGAYEYTMGNVYLGSPYTYNTSGFGSAVDMKYLDTYINPNNSGTAYENGHLGDATRETKSSNTASWDSNGISFPSINRTEYSLWFLRGGEAYYGSTNGIMAYMGNTATSWANYTSRMVITDN